jgi:hypothetical protein
MTMHHCHGTCWGNWDASDVRKKTGMTPSSRPACRSADPQQSYTLAVQITKSSFSLMTAIIRFS